MTTDLFSRPLEELEAGERFATRGRTITEADVVAFAGTTGDQHPQHSDEEWARQSPFGERIAHGLLVLSTAAGLVPFDPERVVALRRVRDATFKRPVPFGTTIRVEGRVAEVQPVDTETGIVECDLRVLDQRDRMVARARVEVLWRAGSEELAADPVQDGRVPVGELVVPL